MRKQNTALTRFGRKVKGSYQSYGLSVKLTFVVILGLCFVFIWSVFSSSSYSVAYQRDTFDDIREPISSANKKKVSSLSPSTKKEQAHNKKLKHRSNSVEKKKKRVDGSLPSKHKNEKVGAARKRKGEDLKLPKKVEEILDQELEGSDSEEEKIENDKQEEEKKVVEGKENEKEKTESDKQEGEGVDGKENEKEEIESNKEGVDGKENEKEEIESNKEEGEGDGKEEGESNGELANSEELDQVDEDEKSRDNGKKKKYLGPIFDPKAHYTWNLCSTRSKHNYIPCIDFESASGKLHNFRHHERSCPRAPQMCLVPLPPDGYETPVSWPESKSKILYKNVAHPKLAAFVKKGSWVVESGEYLTFPMNQSIPKGGIQHYLDFIEEMAPDIEWGKNIRVVLDIGCKDSSFGASLLEKDVLTLTLGLKDDLVDLAQVALERGFPAAVTPFGTRRLPFPSGVFDAIHCGDCHASWHSNGGKHLIEMNRILRPGGYFILSSKRTSIEVEEAMSTLTASICWNILADKTDEISDIRIKLYQKPQANDIYRLRRKKVPPLCQANENPDASWHVSIKSCLHTLPESIEQRGTEWPEEWPKRLETFPDWMNSREKLIADSEHWKAIVNNSYLVGLGIDWSNIRNVMDMKAINGGFAAALAQHKVWVMNVVPEHAPNTLPIVFERGLVGVYHDWCEAFGTYPRSYDLLHADHLFSRLKNRCKHPIVIVVEMDRILRPGGWGIIRDKVEILDPLEKILRSLHWEIRMTFTKDKEGILCAQKSMWRPPNMPLSLSSYPTRLAILTLLSATTVYFFYKSRRHVIKRLNPKKNQNPNLKTPKGKLFFISQTNTSKTLAQKLHTLLKLNGFDFDLVDPKDYEPEDLHKESFVLIIASTWDDGKPPKNAGFFVDWLNESADDFRVGSLLLSKCKFAIFGVGSGSYGETFNAVARDFSRKLRKLGGVEVLGLCEGDVDEGNLDEVFGKWSKRVVGVLSNLGENGGYIGNGVVGDDGSEDEVASEGDDDEEYDDDDDEFEENEKESGIVDLEDIAGKGPSRKKGGVGDNKLVNGKSNGGVVNGEKKAMVTPVIRASLEKQGYKIIGSHSGVKLCRWTKSQLRGRGGCYKHSFYGIESHRCMEATPSLACANKCVFCWRHHTNPVGKSWTWKMDDPIEIVNTAIDLHTKMIKQMKGVPGVKAERLSEGLSPRHCALSLVGEPIMYPEINSLIDELHKRRISTFLVTNAQFPDKIKLLRPITQLYVSVDAGTKDSLKAIDRPLFGDFWERFLDSLKALKEKEQRTVYRLTLVKGWNAEEVDAYSSLFSIGKPDFVEIKGVTYCGSSATSKLTMENVPWHADVREFSEALAKKSNGEYEVACEHVHSCCVILAKVDKFKIDGQWFTWIDYEKFHDLVASGRPFTSKDYMAPTPSWAVYGADEGGFDPEQLRYKKERRHGSSRKENGS
ncbi:uncharacterized protein LOC132034779 [Lycium ferocissimum]|uniref:uncharacterized protein LOC132034779 n=1 Tax=Lycium ferocissimum TaxID=112874 RepID=UPI002814C361|nr:uncharacterized protein LOC132034779 [Lycium ferocissimum]